MPQATMTEPRQLLLHELGDIYYAENLLIKALPRMADEAEDEELRAGFEQHLEETREQVENLREAFRELGEKASGERCPGIEGIQAEHDEFLEQHEAEPALRDVFLTGAGGRVEHYEIAAYSGLIAMARALKEPRVVELLEENLRQEKAALKTLESCGRRLTRGVARAERNGGS
jgi:ferritin-like metal-binding protein YciE